MTPVLPATTASITSVGGVILFARAAELAQVQAVVSQLLRRPPVDLSRETRD
jgi:hypothetical protein